MEMQELIDLLDEVHSHLLQGFPGPWPQKSYSISEEDSAAADTWIREWLRSGPEVPPLTPQLCRALLPRFAVAADFAADGVMRGRNWSRETASKDRALVECLLIEYWPKLQEGWVRGDVIRN